MLLEKSATKKSVLAQHTLAKRVDGGDRRPIERTQRSPELTDGGVVECPEIALARLLVGGRLASSGHEVLELRAHPGTKLVRRFLGERHDEQPIEGDVGGEQDFDDQMLQSECLARAGRSLDDGVPIERQAAQHPRTCNVARAHAAPDDARLAKKSPKRRSTIARAVCSSGDG